MSTETAVAPEQPAAPAPAETEAQPQVEAPLSAAEHRQAVRNRARGTLRSQQQPSAPIAETAQPQSEPKADALGNLHGPDGKFIEKTEGAAEAAPEATAPQPSDVPAADAPPNPSPEAHRIPLPEGDPLRARGKQFLDELEPHEFRSLIKRGALPDVTADVRAEVDAATRRAEELEARYARLEATLRATTESRESLLKDPLIAAKYAELSEKYSPEDAEAYLQGKLRSFDAKAEEYAREAEQKLAAERGGRVVKQFIAETQTAAQARYQGLPLDPYTLGRLYEQAREQYGTEVEVKEARGESVQLSPDRLFHYLDSLVIDQPGVREALRQRTAEQQQAEIARQAEEAKRRAEQEAKERQKKELEEAAQRRARYPMARLPAQAGTTQAVPEEMGGAAAARQRIRDRARGRV